MTNWSLVLYDDQCYGHNKEPANDYHNIGKEGEDDRILTNTN